METPTLSDAAVGVVNASQVLQVGNVVSFSLLKIVVYLCSRTHVDVVKELRRQLPAFTVYNRARFSRTS